MEGEESELVVENKEPRPPDGGVNQTEDSISALVERISSDVFDEWFFERKWAQNIRDGTPYFNGPSNQKPPTDHSPSTLLQCHRKTAYSQLNAPEEKQNPEGIFWIGQRFEEDVALPFLRDSVVGPNQYVTNSLWVDFSVATEAGTLRIRGETDPVIVNREAEPRLLTEIKTKRSVDDIDSPNRHHRAQAHAYMRGLSEKYDQDITTAVILYGGRTNLNIKSFKVEYDPWFFRSVVLGWAETHSTYRLNEQLPPAEPEYDWECNFCSYAERCGRGELDFSDSPPTGLLPGYRYPREKLVEYLEAHEAAKLTPTLAACYPQLADEYDVLDWHCRSCGSFHPWDGPDWNGDVSSMPQCPECSNNEGVLRGPDPGAQSTGDPANE